MNTRIVLDVDTSTLHNLSDQYLAALWHAAQANPAALDDRDACAMVEHIGREIIRRWLHETPQMLWDRQGIHMHLSQLLAGQTKSVDTSAGGDE